MAAVARVRRDARAEPSPRREALKVSRLPSPHRGRHHDAAPPAGLAGAPLQRLDPRDLTLSAASLSRRSRACSSTSPTCSRRTSSREVDPRGRVPQRFDLEATREAMARANGRHHLEALERAIELHLSGSAGTRSAKEDAYRRQLRRSGAGGGAGEHEDRGRRPLARDRDRRRDRRSRRIRGRRSEARTSAATRRSPMRATR